MRNQHLKSLPFHAHIRRSERGMGTIALLLVIMIVVSALMVAGKVIPAYYEFTILRDLADRVVNEYNNLERSEVERRIRYEFNRSKIEIEPEDFEITETASGYSVFVYYLVPMEFEIAEHTIPLGNLEELEWTYEVESP
ncbi:MAG: hypothetical protein HQL50_14295 [Magnetococcales bacterium]|nr:hypothetical protein [Magnetococcales bacterium]